MKKINYTLLLFCLAIGLTSCNKDLGLENFDVQGQLKKDTTAIRAYAVANNIPVVKNPEYPFFYQIIEPGSGAEINKLSTVIVNYKGLLLDGTVFDQTKTPVSIPLAPPTIEGWRLGIPLIRQGGKIRLLLPSVLAYGNRANGPIPANSVLDFFVEIVDVK
jgi:FKBP-type peptidyl-prolyl cis-trans isomerase FkpA